MKEIKPEELKKHYEDLRAVASESNSHCLFAIRGDGTFVDGSGKYADPYQVLKHMEQMRKVINETTQFFSGKM